MTTVRSEHVVVEPRRVLTSCGLAGLCLAAISLLTAAPASAHPLGNFTVNSHIGLRVEPAAIALHLVVDSAEIPTVQAFGSSTPAVAAPEAQRYRDVRCTALVGAVDVQVDGEPVSMTVSSSALEFPPGEAGLATTRLECNAVSSRVLDTVGATVELTGTPQQAQVGWHEVVAVGDGVTLASSDVPSESVSGVLRDYPAELLQSPLDVTSARLTVGPGSGEVAGADPDGGGLGDSRVDAVTQRFTGLIASPDLTAGLALLAFGGAVVLGAAHAFAPGHGKTLMAAYLVGQEGSLRQASMIGLSVTVTHTAGVLLLGVVLSTVAVAAPERVYPWLGLLSGVLVAAIGVTLLRRALARRRHHDHVSDHVHAHAPAGVAVAARADALVHAHGDGPVHVHGDGPVHAHGDGPAHSHDVANDVRGLLAVGFAGGLVPAPSAVVVLLGGIALGRAWLGVLLVLAYGIGMALALVGTGLALVHARGYAQRWSARPAAAGAGRVRVLRVIGALPLATAAVVVVVGTGLTIRALTQI